MKQARNPGEGPGEDDKGVKTVGDETVQINIAMAWSHNTPPEVLAQLAKDSKVTVRYLVAINPNTSTEVILLLMQDEAKVVKEAAMERV
jgi:hypothetical protein